MIRKLIIGLGAIALSTTVFAAGSNALGNKIFSQHCAVCHTSGVAGAPKAHDTKAWDTRLDKAMTALKKTNPKATKKEAMNTFVTNVKKGMGAMPAGGMCPKCSDKDYQAAIKFMMAKKSN